MKKAAQSQPALDDTEIAAAEPESEFNVAEYLGMVRRHWKLVTAACLIAVAAGAIHYAITPKAYMATSIIQIERRTLAPTLNSQAPWLESYFDAEYYPTQYALLESRGLAERVVKRLDLSSDPAFNPGRTAAATALPPAATAANGDHRAATVDDDLAVLGGLAERLRSGLTVEPVRNTQLVEISYRAASPMFAARAANGFADAFIDMGIEYRFTSAGKTSTFLGSQIEALHKEIQEKESKLQAYSRRTDIVTMDPGANVTMQRLQSLNTSYMEAKNARIDKESIYHGLTNAPDSSIADTLQPGLLGTLRSDELRLERDYDSKLKTYKPDWPAMLQLKGEIEKSKQHIQSVVAEMVSNARKSAYNAYVTSLAQEQELEGEINKIKAKAMDQNSEAVEYNSLSSEIKARRDTLDELQHKHTENEVQARLQDTRDSNVHIVDRALVPGGPFYPSLRKDVSYALLFGLLLGAGAALLIEFLDRTVKTAEEVERRLGLPTLAVIQDIVEAGRTYGYAERYGYGYFQAHEAAARGGAAAPAATAAAPPPAAGAASARRRTGWSGRDARPATGGAPAADAAQAGTAPGAASNALAAGAAGAATSRAERKRAAASPAQIELVPHEIPRSQISEAYRSLRTALLLSSAHTLKVVAVTSAAAGEGKTATATNLAIVLAQLGRPVLIVDADLRKPRLHQVFHISNQIGLVSYLAGNLNASEIVQRTAVPHLWIVPSGPIAPNPSELLSSDRMKEWLHSVRAQFEYIIVDTPPALAVTDATIVGVMADGVVMTLRSGKVTREEARLCRDRLRQADVRILGAVLNRYRSSHSGLGKRYRAYESYVAADQPVAPKAGSAA